MLASRAPKAIDWHRSCFAAANEKRSLAFMTLRNGREVVALLCRPLPTGASPGGAITRVAPARRLHLVLSCSLREPTDPPRRDLPPAAKAAYATRSYRVTSRLLTYICD